MKYASLLCLVCLLLVGIAGAIAYLCSDGAAKMNGARLELTYNPGVESYEIGTGYGHIAITVDDIHTTLEPDWQAWAEQAARQPLSRSIYPPAGSPPPGSCRGAFRR